MKSCLFVLAFLCLTVPAAAETITVRTPNERFRVIDVVRRTNVTLFAILDTKTGEISYRRATLPRRRFHISTSIWDPHAGRYRELIGYDSFALPVYRDDDHSRVVYWITERTTSGNNWQDEWAPDPSHSPSDRGVK